MTLNPALAKLLAEASAKYQAEPEDRSGIIPFPAIDIDPRNALIDVATIISEALTGPAIGVLELAEMIVDTVQEAA